MISCLGFNIACEYPLFTHTHTYNTHAKHTLLITTTRTGFHNAFLYEALRPSISPLVALCFTHIQHTHITHLLCVSIHTRRLPQRFSLRSTEAIHLTVGGPIERGGRRQNTRECCWCSGESGQEFESAVWGVDQGD